MKEKFFVAIPTYKRVGNVHSLKLFPNATLFCNYGELADYKKEYPKAKIVECPPEIIGLTKKLNFIIEYCEKKKIKRLLKVDDDFIKFVSFIGGTHKEITDLDYLNAVIERLFIMCEDAGTRLFTFAPTADVRRYEGAMPFRLFSSIKIGIYGMVIGDGYRFDERFLLKQDVDCALDTALKYKHFFVENRYSFAFKETMKNVGGCAEYRNNAKEQEMISLLRAKWGNDAFIVSRTDKGDMTINVKYPFK